MFVIEDIAVDRFRNRVSETTAALDCGQSFFVPDSYGKNRVSLASTVTSIGRRLGRKFSMRRVEGGYRIGRVA